MSVVCRCPVVRSLEGVGRPGWAGRPEPVASVTALLLILRTLCPRRLVHGLPLCSWSYIAHIFEVVAMSHMRVHLESNGVSLRSRDKSFWGLESSRSVHGDDRGMLRIISPLGKDPTSDRDPHHHGNGCHRRTCSWTKLKTWRNPSSPRCRRSDRHAKRANTSNTRKYNG